ncbi:MAG: hypothetical protein ACI9MR_004038 [Myxococcota bacterium]|jgi:hypothetical protein
MRLIPALLAVFVLSTFGCDKETPKPAAPEAPQVTSAPARAEPATKPPKAAVATPAPTHSKPKAYKNPEAAAIGTLPEGVGIPVGQKAPDTIVSGLDGKPLSLASLSQDGPLLLVFYRGGW